VFSVTILHDSQLAVAGAEFYLYIIIKFYDHLALAPSLLGVWWRVECDYRYATDCSARNWYTICILFCTVQ